MANVSNMRCHNQNICWIMNQTKIPGKRSLKLLGPLRTIKIYCLESDKPYNILKIIHDIYQYKLFTKKLLGDRVTKTQYIIEQRQFTF